MDAAGEAAGETVASCADAWRGSSAPVAGIVATSYTRATRAGGVPDTDTAGFPAAGVGVSEAAGVSLAAQKAQNGCGSNGHPFACHVSPLYTQAAVCSLAGERYVRRAVNSAMVMALHLIAHGKAARIALYGNRLKAQSAPYRTGAKV